MKYLKLFSILVLSAMTLTVVAASTAEATITITADGTTYADKVDLFQDDAVNADFSDPDNAPDNKSTLNDYCVNMWAVGPTLNYSCVVIPDLEGLVIKFKANNHHTDYTISFSYVSGEEYFLQQEGKDEFIPMTADYGFTCALNAEITFTIVKTPEALFYPREVANGSWGTICYPELITSVEGAVVYELAGRNADATQIAVVPVAAADMVAGKPYLFNATADAQKFFYDPDVTDDLQAGANGLTGTFVDATLVTDGFYVVKGQSFIPALGTSTVLANRAYLALTDISAMEEYVPTPGVSARFFSVVRGAATEDMQVAADGVKDGAYLVNGHLVIVKDGKTYSAQGF